MKWNILLTVSCLLMCSHSGESIADGKENQLIERYPGTVIKGKYSNDLMTYKIANGPIKDDLAQALSVDGQLDHILYKAPKDISILRVFRSIEATVKQNEFELLYSCSNETCGGDLVDKLIASGDQKHYASVRYDGPVNNEFYYLSSKKNVNGADIYLNYFIYKYSNRPLYIAQDILNSNTTSVTTLKMNLDFSKMQSLGKVVLHGVLFESGNANLTNESKSALKEIAAYLKKNSGKRFHVVGHTDSDGNFENNLKLSNARANKVKEFLVNEHAIKSNMLSAHGLASLAPVKSNFAAEGRTLNRRVELVEN